MHDREERTADEHDGNLGKWTPKEYISIKCLQAEWPSSSLPPKQSMSRRALCGPRIVQWIYGKCFYMAWYA